MDDLSGLSERDLERLLTGRANGNAPDEIVEVLAQLRAEYLEATPEEVERAHLAAMLAESQRLASEPKETESSNGAVTSGTLAVKRSGPQERPSRPRRALAIAAVALAAPFSVVGLALAGVTVPEALRAPFEAIGIDLPNQPGEASSGAATNESLAPTRDRPAPAPGIARDSGQRGCALNLGQPLAPGVRAASPGLDPRPCEAQRQAQGRAGSGGRSRAQGESRGRGPRTDGKAPGSPGATSSDPTPPRPNGGTSNVTGTGSAGGPSAAPPPAPEPQGSTGKPTTPPGNSGSNPFEGPPGITGAGAPGQTGAAPPGRGGKGD